MNMDIINNSTIPTTESRIPKSKRAAGRMAFLQAFKNLFTARNPIRKFQDAYRFNIIRWSASNLRTPSWSKRIGLFLQTKNPFSLLRDDYRMNRNHLLNNWEIATINDINRTLASIGRIPLQSKDRGIFKILNGIEKKIKRLDGYNGCPDMQHENVLLATYRYILSSPFDHKFSGLAPDDICEMLQQNGLSLSNLPYQNYEGILQGRETALYELATRQNGTNYLRPADHVKLNLTAEGSSMEFVSRFPKKEILTTQVVVPAAIEETLQASEKLKKTSAPKESGKQQRSSKRKANSVKLK